MVLNSIMSSANGDSFTSSIPSWIPFNYLIFSCLIAVAKTFNTMLNKHSESGYSCFILNLGGKAFNFSPLSMMLAGG